MLKLASILSFGVSLLHIVSIPIGAAAYRFLGAGEEMAMMTLITGMDRNGTSMMTRKMDFCGFDSGPEERHLPPLANNAAGSWEDTPR